MRITILLADDHQIVRDGLRALLESKEFEVVAEVADGFEAVEEARTLRPHVALLDLNMPRMNGLLAAGEIRRVAPQTRVILLTMFTERQYVVGAMRAGVHGFVIKSQAAADLHQAIRLVTQGHTYLSPEISQTVVEMCAGEGMTRDPLTTRERQVLQLIAEGKTTKEAARILEISTKTAESHRTRLMGKLGLHDTASLVRYAIREGVIAP